VSLCACSMSAWLSDAQAIGPEKSPSVNLSKTSPRP
jgi:hypothetical protein